jgi:hypothetical protein
MRAYSPRRYSAALPRAGAPGARLHVRQAAALESEALPSGFVPLQPVSATEVSTHCHAYTSLWCTAASHTSSGLCVHQCECLVKWLLLEQFTMLQDSSSRHGSLPASVTFSSPTQAVTQHAALQRSPAALMKPGVPGTGTVTAAAAQADPASPAALPVSPAWAADEDGAQAAGCIQDRVDEGRAHAPLVSVTSERVSWPQPGADRDGQHDASGLTQEVAQGEDLPVVISESSLDAL